VPGVRNDAQLERGHLFDVNADQRPFARFERNEVASRSPSWSETRCGPLLFLRRRGHYPMGPCKDRYTGFCGSRSPV
jgi:hypothetical protein